MKSHLLPTLGLPPPTSDSLFLGTASLGSFGLSSHLVMVVLPLTCFHGLCGCLEHARPFLKLPLGSLANPPFCTPGLHLSVSVIRPSFTVCFGSVVGLLLMCVGTEWHLRGQVQVNTRKPCDSPVFLANLVWALG